MLRAAVVLVAGVLWCCVSLAATINVPADYPTIQAAIDAAVPLSALGLTPTSGMVLKGDVGVIFSDAGGDRNEARRVTEPVPLKRPVGLTVAAGPGDPNATLYVTDAETKQLWRTSFWLPELKPDNEKWATVTIANAPLTAPTDLQALTDGRLLLADTGRLLLLMPTDTGFAVERLIDRWGDTPADRFGERLRFAMDGTSVLVSDCTRHRVLWLDFESWRLLAQFGETDVAGNDRAHLSSPDQVALSGARTVVADTGNQRVVKLTLVP